jgi:hypothetical protein
LGDDEEEKNQRGGNHGERIIMFSSQISTEKNLEPGKWIIRSSVEQ